MIDSTRGPSSREAARHEADRARIARGADPYVCEASLTDGVRRRQEPRPEECEIMYRDGQSLGEVVRRMRSSNASLIALDGLPGAGKSTLAVELSALLNVPPVHLDDYLVFNSPGFIEHLDYEKLQCALSGRAVIVEGVCMLDVLDRMGLRPDQFVYLRAPISARYLDTSHPLVREVRAYTERAHPVDRATFVLVRSESGQKPFGLRKRGQAELDAFVSRNRSRIARLLATVGIITLLAGALAVVTGSSGRGDSPFRIVGLEFSVPEMGVMTMLTSGLSIILACSSISRSRRRSSSSGR